MNKPLTISHIIGTDRLGDAKTERHNPANANDVVVLTPSGDESTVADAISAAQAAQPAWAALTGPARGNILLDAAGILLSRLPEVARDLTREEGKTIAEASGEVRRAVDVLRFFGGEGWRMSGQNLPSSVPNTFVYTRKEPIGVVAAITPWNFPIAIPAWKIAPALISGNAVVLKPAEITPLSTWHLAHALIDAGLPAGVLNVIFGRGSTMGNALVSNKNVGAISFTGSVSVGNAIYDVVTARHARVQLEMGGKNPLVVLDDADPATAARIAAMGGFALTGQACTATSRVICTPGVKADFISALVAEARRFAPGDGLSDGVLMGPVVSESQLKTDQEYLDIAVSQGAEIVTDAEKSKGLLQAPVVLTGVKADHRVAQEEVFGPVVAVMDADDLDHAISVANAVPFGLAAGIVTKDISSAHRFANKIHAGVVKINRPTTGLDLNVPFGGVKDSSTNTFREQGASAVDFYTWSKSVYLGFD